MNNKKYSIFCIIFIMILLYPMIGTIIDKKMPLYGVSGSKNLPNIDLNTIMTGNFQAEMDEYLKETVSGRNLFVKMYSQILYSWFNTSSNDNVVIGDNFTLYEPEYLEYNFNISQQVSKENIRELVNKLKVLNLLLEKNGKQLFIFITPSKARYYFEEAPYYYKLCAKMINAETTYDMFIDELEKTELKKFDSINFINNHKQEYVFPLYYKSGIHWSRVLGSKVAEGFNEYLREESGYELGQIHSEFSISDNYETPDADLYETLNLFTKPSDETFYKVNISVNEGKDKPNVFLRGGSFMGQSLSYLVTNGIFGKDIHFENNYYFTNKYSNQTVLSNFNSYNEIDIPKYLSESDILILEVNENKIWTMSWGFIDYILENPECVEGENR